MQFPFFYLPESATTGERVALDEDTARHITLVLRMQEGEQLHLTDGRGRLLTALIEEAGKKKCRVKITDASAIPAESAQVTIAISLLKNTGRFEWFLEKATEIGVNTIIPLQCERTEHQHFRAARMQQVLVSAMLQSRRSYLPELKAPVDFGTLVSGAQQEQKFIAHCLEDGRTSLAGMLQTPSPGRLIVIGPEGDFTPAEIELALRHQFIPVELGAGRLRSETAGVVAATLLKIAARR